MIAMTFTIGCDGSGSLTLDANQWFASPDYTRAEFESLVKGKTAEEVIALVGRPDSTLDHSPTTDDWVYSYLTTDPVTGKADRTTHLYFEDGKADWIMAF